VAGEAIEQRAADGALAEDEDRRRLTHDAPPPARERDRPRDRRGPRSRRPGG
jgi:hypothetical protein